jgi:predicted MFS family arabinose efflux permease
MIPALHLADRRGYTRSVFLASISIVACSQVLLLFPAGSLIGICVALLVFFAGFMVLEAALPAHVSRAAPPGARGTAIAVYGTVQFLGAACGSALGGYLAEHWGRPSLLGANVAMLLVWLVAAWGMRGQPARALQR